MSPAYRKYYRVPLRHRAIGWLALAAYLAAAFGFPVPDLAGEFNGAPFPCQGHGCGCRSAQHCWTNCCCFTPEEKQAWAQRTGVTVPSDAQQVEPRAAHISNEPVKKKSCCGGAHSLPPAASKKSPPAAKSRCCTPSKPSTTSCCSAADDSPAASPRPTRNHWQLIFNSFKCRGLGSTWLAIPEVAAPPPPLLGYAVMLAPSGLVADLTPFVPSISFPPTPPPG